MSSQAILHALGLHLYQPAGSLHHMLRDDPVELMRILLCYERIARHAHKYSRVAKLHLALSPVLLEQLAGPELIEACRDLADIPAILDGLRSAAAIELVASGLRHAPLPLIPKDDWDEQLRSERTAMEAALGRVPKGYWPPAELFVAEMVPALVKAGYEYLMLPTAALATPDGAGVDPYRPYLLCHNKACIPVVPLDRVFSQAQEHGLEAPWLADTARDSVARAPASDAPYLLATWSDGENGEWFRRIDEEHGFFGQFFSPYMEFCETGEFPVRPVFLSEYLHAYRPRAEAHLLPADPIPALDEASRVAVEKVAAASARYWSLARYAAGQDAPSPQAMIQARDLLLRAEESALLLGEASRQAQLLGLLAEAERLMASKPARAAATELAEPAPPGKATVAPQASRPAAPAPVGEAPAQPAQPASPPDASLAPVTPEPAGPTTEPKTAVQPAEPKQPDSPSRAPSAPKRAVWRKPAPRGKAKTRTTRLRKRHRKRR